MTVALVLATAADRGRLTALGGQLAALGVRRVDAAERSGHGMLTVAAAARSAGERVLICNGTLPGDALTRLLRYGGTAALPAAYGSGGVPEHDGALIVRSADLEELAGAAEELAGAAEELAGTRRAADPVGALFGELARRGVRVRVLDGTGGGDGPVAELIADPAASDIARWAAERELTPVALYGISLGLGVIAATWFTELALRATVAAFVMLFASFVAGRAGRLMEAGRRHTAPAADWLRVACALLTEIAVYAAIAASTTAAPGAAAQAGLAGLFGRYLQGTSVATLGGAGQGGVWRLALAAMIMLGLRQMTGLCAAGGTARAPWSVAGRQALMVITLPDGERLLLAGAGVILAGPRLVFLLLLGWGALALGYVVTARLSAGRAVRAPAEVAGYRGDGPLALWIGRAVDGRLPPMPPLIVGLLVTGMLTALGLGNLPGILVFTPAEAMLLAALGACHPHDGPRDWLVPPLLQAGEYLFLAALAYSHRVTAPVTYALLAAVVLRHLDLAYRARNRMPAARFTRRPGRLPGADWPGLGWDGRMLLAAAATVLGVLPYAYAALAAQEWLLLGRDFVAGWSGWSGWSGGHAAVYGRRRPSYE
ncbi:MAG: hypothetical protein JOY82_00680 [Streptosporangiaceae bacterium]|nr:hypothetical protein [Streptosporangiaceae bacterium]MBV9853028.1 hypothetical protein [Streptosporangiaceae bacterium]